MCMEPVWQSQLVYQYSGGAADVYVSAVAIVAVRSTKEKHVRARRHPYTECSISVCVAADADVAHLLPKILSPK